MFEKQSLKLQNLKLQCLKLQSLKLQCSKLQSLFWVTKFNITLKLGYNELTVITNKLSFLAWFRIFYQLNVMLITNKRNEFTVTTNKIFEI